ncbi:MAG TPA: hypothetical protein VJ617_18860 [Arthrobacter sp.]|nr:hypothetical protein [Arthrobacter sp.]
MSRRLIILLSVFGALVVAGAAGAVVLTNILRGGADSPEQAVTKSIEAMSKKDLVGLFTMVSPHERDALVRVQDAVVKKAKDEGVAEAAKSVASTDSGQGGSDLVFDGVEVTFSGINPSVSQVSDDVAVVHISSGEIKLKIDPAQTKGAIRSIYDNFESPSPTDQTWDIGDLGPSRSGLSVLASKKDGRWYVNVAGSVLEAVNSYQGTPRGVIPPPSQGGSDKPQTAAKSAVQAAQTQAASQVAPFLVKDEANIFYLYGHLWNEFNKSSSSKFSFGNVDFTEGPHEGNRAQAYVSQINVVTGSSDKFTLTDKCINNSSSSQDGNCLNGSAYQMGGYGYGEINWMSALLSHDGKFALTTVNEDGKWKVSLLDSVADHLVSAVNSLTHEQTLAVSSLARTQTASGSINLAESKNLDFNNAGYAVASLKLDKATKLQLDKDSTLGTVTLFTADGKESKGGVFTGYYNDVTFEPGEYKVLAWAGSGKFRDASRTDGKPAGLSEPITIREFVPPSGFDGRESISGAYVTSSAKTFSLTVPTDQAGALLVEVESVSSANVKIVATVDGTTYAVDATPGKVTGIPAPQGSRKLTLDVESTSKSSYSYDYAYVSLSFEKQ